MGVEHTIIPVRFLTTVGHLIATLMLFYTRRGNVLASLPLTFTPADYNSIDNALEAGLFASCVCFSIEYFGLFGGFSLFSSVANTFIIFAHFCGCIVLSWFILDNWHYTTFWYNFVFFSLFPALLESFAIARVLFCKVVQY